MKKSEFKEYLKTEILQMSEATKEEVDTQKELNAELILILEQNLNHS